MSQSRQNSCRAARCLLLLLALAWDASPRAVAGGRGSLTMNPSPEVILADGKSQTTITANVRSGSGQPAPDGTTVRFTTSLGTLDKDTVPTVSGVARVLLTSAPSAGTATVTATSFLGGGDGSSTGSTSVEYTTDRDAVYSSGDARWIQIDCPEGVLYSADDKEAEAHGKHGSVRLHYRTLDISADSLQVNLQAQTLLAHNATLQRGHHTLQAVELRYDLGSGLGTAVVAGTGRHAFQSVQVSGYALQTAPLDADAADEMVQTNIFRFDDISDAHVIVASRALDADPGDQIQFRRATIFSDGKKVLSVPLHVMSMNSEELFGQQLLGFGSEGFFVNVPFYYHVSPHSTGTLYLRNSAVAGSNSTGISLPSSFSTNGTRPGLSLDLQQTYALGRGGAGSLLVNGITRGDWGAQWNHTQRIDDATNSYIYVDYPEHRSLYASSSVSRQFSGFSMNVLASGSRDPGFDGYKSSNQVVSAYAQTTPRQIGHSGVNMVTNLSVQRGRLTASSPDLGTQVVPISTRGLDFRFFTAPLRPDRHTNVSDSLTLGQSWNDYGQSSPTLLGTLGLTRTTFGRGNLTLNYTYRYDPLLSTISSSSTATDPLSSLYRSKTQQRLTLGYSVAPRPKLSVSLFGSYGLPLNDSNLFTTINYRVDKDWGLGFDSFWDHYGAATYREDQLSLSRRVLGRDLVFTYSTKTKKVRFDLAASGLAGL